MRSDVAASKTHALTHFTHALLAPDGFASACSPHRLTPRVLLSSLCLLALCLALLGCTPAPQHLPPTAHLTTAQAWSSPSHQWEPPGSLETSDDAVLAPSTPWTAVDLPNARARKVAGAADPALEPPQVLWYRVELPVSALQPTPQGPRLYIPRWQTVGTQAIYLNGELLWQSRGSRVWNSFNRPIWLDLGGHVPTQAPAVVHIRAAMSAGVGGGLSTIWVGPAEDLRGAWRVRSLVQADLVALMRGAYLVLGIFALSVWLVRRRGGDVYLLFFVMSVCHLLSSLHYLVDSEGFFLSDDWFAWLTLAGSQGSLLCSFHFLCLIEQRRRPRLARALLIYVLLVTLAALPFWAPALTTMLPLLRLTLAPPALLALGIAIAGAWRRRTPGSILLAVWIAASFPMGLHDLALQNYRGLEQIYLTPYSYLGMFTLFLVIALNRYTNALGVAASASATLAERLSAQERDLATTHARLREVERASTLLNERQRVMREMHDGVGSSLMSALRLVESQPAAEIDVAQVLRECIDDLKIAIDSLEPVDADLLALLANLRFRLGPRLEGAGLRLNWAVNDLPPVTWLDAQSALHVLRILQEVLTNIIKHSGARQITFRTEGAVEFGTPGVRVQIEDDGHPFTPSAANEHQAGRKGLGNVQARARALGARVEWTPQPARGTVFTLWLPLESPLQDRA